MDISDDDLDEILSALSEAGFSMPFMARISEYGPSRIAEADAEAERNNRRALNDALESTRAWSRYRIY